MKRAVNDGNLIIDEIMSEDLRSDETVKSYKLKNYITGLETYDSLQNKSQNVSKF